MKSRIRALIPIKIENRLVPKDYSDTLSSGSSSHNDSFSSPIKNITAFEQYSVYHHSEHQLRRNHTVSETSPTIKVTIHRSPVLKRSSMEMQVDEHKSEQLITQPMSPTYAGRVVRKQGPEVQVSSPSLPNFYRENHIVPKTADAASKEYYNEIDARISNGIKKLEEMDKKMQNYQKKQAQSPRLFKGTLDVKKQQPRPMPDNVNQLKQTIAAMARKKEEYLQELLSKSKKINQLEGAIAERDREIVSYEGQVKLANTKIGQLEQSLRKSREQQQSYKQGLGRFYLQNSSLKRELEIAISLHRSQLAQLQKALHEAQANSNTQAIAALQKTHQKRQSALVQQLREQKSNSDRAILLLNRQKQTTLEEVQKKHEEELHHILTATAANMEQMRQGCGKSEEGEALRKEKEELQGRLAEQVVLTGQRIAEYDRLAQLHAELQGKHKAHQDESAKQKKIYEQQINNLKCQLSNQQAAFIQHQQQLKQLKTQSQQNQKALRLQFDSKSKQIFDKLREFYQEKQRLNQEISAYKTKILEKERELSEQGYRMHQFENMVKSKQATAEPGLQESLKRKVAQHEGTIASILQSCAKYQQQIPIEISKFNQPTACTQTNPCQLVDRLLCDSIKTIHSLQQQAAKARQNAVNIPERDTTAPHRTQAAINTDNCQMKSTQAQTEDDIVIDVVEMKSQGLEQAHLSSAETEQQKEGKNAGMEVTQSQDHTGEEAEPYSLRQELAYKQHIIGQLQTCIQDYKELLAPLTARLKTQQQIEHHYNEILQFFEIDASAGLGQAHEELLELMGVLMAKLEGTVQAVRGLEEELARLGDENRELRDKKKKIVREVKKYEIVVERACLENEEFRAQAEDLRQKLEAATAWVRQLLKTIQDCNEEMVSREMQAANCRFIAKYGNLQDQQDQIMQINCTELGLGQAGSVSPGSWPLVDQLRSPEVMDYSEASDTEEHAGLA